MATATSKNLNLAQTRSRLLGSTQVIQQDAIRKGIFVGSVTQDPVQIGY